MFFHEGKNYFNASKISHKKSSFRLNRDRELCSMMGTMKRNMHFNAHAAHSQIMWPGCHDVHHNIHVIMIIIITMYNITLDSLPIHTTITHQSRLNSMYTIIAFAHFTSQKHEVNTAFLTRILNTLHG